MMVGAQDRPQDRRQTHLDFPADQRLASSCSKQVADAHAKRQWRGGAPPRRKGVDCIEQSGPAPPRCQLRRLRRRHHVLPVGGGGGQPPHRAVPEPAALQEGPQHRPARRHPHARLSRPLPCSGCARPVPVAPGSWRLGSPASRRCGGDEGVGRVRSTSCTTSRRGPHQSLQLLHERTTLLKRAGPLNAALDSAPSQSLWSAACCDRMPTHAVRSAIDEPEEVHQARKPAHQQMCIGTI